MAQKPALGKGLASLFPNSAPPGPPPGPPPGLAGSSSTSVPVEQNTRDRHLGISMVSIDEIHANHLQPRRDFDDAALKELAQSIKINGIIQPLVVRKGDKSGYELIAGERRLRAAKLSGLKQVPIVIRRSTDKESLELALIENIQRENLNCIDEALAYFQLIQDFGLKQEEVAERVGKDRATVSNYIRLLRLPEAIIDDLKKQILSFGHGKALLSLEDADQRLRVRAQVVEKHMSVRETEALVDAVKRAEAENKQAPNGTPATTPLKSRLDNLCQELTRQWSTRVEMKGSERRGKIIIHYSNRQELDRILEAMQNKSV